nr:MAG TPA: hypothetical protein [Bacteriophage sp.]
MVTKLKENPFTGSPSYLYSENLESYNLFCFMEKENL